MSSNPKGLETYQKSEKNWKQGKQTEISNLVFSFMERKILCLVSTDFVPNTLPGDLFNHIF